MSDWATNFERALRESGEIDRIGNLTPWAPNVGWPALTHIGLQFVTRFVVENEKALRVESPIEEAMLFSLLIAGWSQFEAVELKRHREPELEDVLWVQPQVQLGEYRVDFLLTARHRWGYGERYVDTGLVVECDGHDFHDRTKEQASRDRARDRELQRFGFPVYRYTGSDIWRDPLGCAHEALLVLRNNTRARRAQYEEVDE